MKKRKKKNNNSLKSFKFIRSFRATRWCRLSKFRIKGIVNFSESQRGSSSYNRDRHRHNQSPARQRLSTLRRRRVRRRTGAREGPRMAQKVLQVSRLQQNARLDHRLRRARQRRLL